MTKNFVLASVIAAVIIVGVSQPVQAQVTSDVQEQIQALMARIQELTARVHQLRGFGATPSGVTAPSFPGVRHRVCNILYRNIALNTEGDDVRGLQEFLRDQGFFTVAPTGFFGSVTSNALRRWQAANDVDAAGVFGPVSRERIRLWCGGGVNQERFTATPQRGQAPLAVTFSTWLSGFRANNISYVIDFGDGSSERAADCPAPADACTGPGQNTHTYTANGTYTATLKKITTNTCTGTSDVACAAWESREDVVGRVQINVGEVACTLEYAPVCGAKPVTCVTTPCDPVPTTYGNRCAMNADGASFLYAGACRPTTNDPASDPQCKRWSNAGWCSGGCVRETPGGTPQCFMPGCALPADGVVPPHRPAQCLEYFDSAENRPPIISSFSGPTTLAVNGTGTWTVAASDPENGQLSYQVRWGDEGVINQLLAFAQLEGAFVQNTTFTHAYSSAGTYTVTVVVRDSAGQVARTSTTVRVGNTETAVCTTEYAPVCASIPCVASSGFGVGGANCSGPTINKTFSNRCLMNAHAGASFRHEGTCQADVIACTADAMQCPDGSWVGRTGPNCQFVCPTAWNTGGFVGVAGEPEGGQCGYGQVLHNNQCYWGEGFSADGSCWFNNQKIANGSWIAAYEKQFVAGASYRDPCKLEVRTCQSGTLTGSYQYPTCTASDIESSAGAGF